MTPSLSTDKLEVGSNESLALYAFTRDDALKPDANILLFHHGISEYAERYKAVIDRLFDEVPLLDAVISYDIRGHGKQASGSFCRVESVGVLAQDFGAAFRYVTKKYGPMCRIVVAGHSLGGLTVSAAASDAESPLNSDSEGSHVAGVFLSSPSIQIIIPGVVNRMIAPLTKYVNKIPGMRKVTKANGLAPSVVSKDEDVVKAYAADPLCHPLVSFGIAEDLLGLGNTVLARLAADEQCSLLLNNVPSLTMFGEEDPLVSPEGGEKLVAAVRGKDLAKFVVIPGARHEVFNELKPARDAYFQELSGFLSARFASAASSA